MATKPKSFKENGAVQATNVPSNEVSLCSTLSDAQESVIREIISRATDKWSLWALSELAGNGPLRFSRLMDRVEGVRQKSLTATLRHLEREWSRQANCDRSGPNPPRLRGYASGQSLRSGDPSTV